MYLNWSSPLCDTSYGLCSSYFVSELMDLGWDICLHPLGPVQLEQKFYDKFLPKLQPDQIWRWYSKAPSVKLYHQFDLHNGFPTKGPQVGFPIFELDGFHELERKNLEDLDILAVCSEWARQMIWKNTNRKDIVHVVPLGVDTSIFRPLNLPKQDNIFRLFNVGKWERRKGHDILIQAFCETFSQDDRVELWMMSDNGWIGPEGNKKWEDLYTKSKLGNKIGIIHRVDSHDKVAQLMNCMDCGVFPSRAEGFNMEALEVLACGKQLIITNTTAHTEFCNMGNSQLIELHGQELASDGVFFNGQGQWGAFDNQSFQDLKDQMRLMYELHQQDNLPVNEAGLRTAEEFSWKNSTQKLSRILEESV
ncbi:MAG: glycosyltransferase [Nitrososphaerales archaeon]